MDGLYEKIMNMTNKEAADILRKSFCMFKMGRGNSRSIRTLMYTVAINKAIQALEKMKE